MRDEDFTDHIDVECMRCKNKAVVCGASVNTSVAEQEENVKFVCASCEFEVRYANVPKVVVDISSQGTAKYGRLLFLHVPVDPFFGFALWYRIDVKEEVLWAYNLEHLTLIEKYLLNLSNRENGSGAQIDSLLGSLPKWVYFFDNRQLVLRLIANLKNK